MSERLRFEIREGGDITCTKSVCRWQESQAEDDGEEEGEGESDSTSKRHFRELFAILVRLLRALYVLWIGVLLLCVEAVVGGEARGGTLTLEFTVHRQHRLNWSFAFVAPFLSL